MEIVLLALGAALSAALLAGLAGSASTWKTRRRRRDAWAAAVAVCGLPVDERFDPWGSQRQIQAWVGPLEVRVEDAGRHTRVVAVVPDHPEISHVKIRRHRLKPPEPEIEIGDEPFDRAFHVVGPLWLLCVLLDAETRSLLLKVSTEISLEIAHGELRAEMPNRQLSAVLPLLLAIGQRLARPLNAAQRLAENVRNDPAAGVRLLNLLSLLSEHPGDRETVETLRAACSDAIPQIRLRAALGLGAEGRAVLAALAESAEDDAVSARSVSLLGRELPIERARDILDHALRNRHLQTGRACLEQLARGGDPADVDVLAQVMAGETGELATAAALALGSLGSPAAEPPLIQALQREPEDLQVAAATALGRVGTTAAVLSLEEAVERFPHNPDLPKAALQAIAAIQSRLPGASPGQLSLAGADVGNLSFAQAEGGELSIATDPVGRLSLSGGEEAGGETSED